MANLSNINNKFLVTTTGEVLIGQTSNNGNRLQITGADGASYIYLKTDVATTGGRIGFNGDALRVFNQQASGELNLGTAGTTRLTINSSGNATFSGKVNIQGNPPITANANFNDLVITDSGNSGISIFSGNANDGAIYFGDTDANNSGQFKYLHGSNKMTFATSDADRLFIEVNGIYPPIGPTTGTTYYGYNAGLNVGSNSHNTYYGYYAGRANTGTRNTFIGSQTAYAVTNNVNYSVIIGYNALKTAANTAESNVIIGDNAMGSSSGASNGIVIGQGAANLMTGNNNTVVGCEAYRSATTGTSAVIIGYQAGYSASAIGHVIIGWRAGYVNQANSNVYIGQEAGRNNTSGASNVFIGVDAGYANATGSSNTYVGTQAGTYHTGGQNTSFGHKSLFGVSNASSGSYNTAVGFYAGYGNKGTNNTCLGAIAGRFMLTGEQNTIVGSQASDNNDITGNENVVLGFATAQKLTSGSENTILGSGAAITGPITGSNNVFVGRRAAYSMGSAAANTIIGHQAGYYLSSGSQNTGVGKGALTNVTSGTNHTTLGYTAGDEITTGTNCIAIGFAAGSGSSPRQMTTNSNEIVIGSNAIVGAYIRVAWTTGSDKRDKINFNNVPHGLDFVNKLKPTSYDLRKERDSDETIGKRKYGFIAQEILELEGDNPVIIDNSDENKLALQDSNLIPILVNAIQELKAEIELLKSK